MRKTFPIYKKTSTAILLSGVLALTACSSDSDNDSGYKGFGNEPLSGNSGGGSTNAGGNNSGGTGNSSGGGNPTSPVGVSAFVVTGKVQDQAQNPVANATVTIAGQSVTTNAQGVYSIANLPVNNQEPITISVASANHLDFSYVVTPNENNTFVAETGSSCSSFNNASQSLSELFTNSANQNATVCAADASTLATTDTLTVTVKRFDGANEPVANTAGKLEWVASSLPEQAGVTFNNPPVLIQTSNAGVLTVTNLPVDSQFALSLVNFKIDSVNPLQNIAGENAANVTISASDVYVAQENQDLLAPKITSLNGVLSIEGNIAKLNQNITGDSNPLIFQFNESLDASKFNAANVTLTDSNSAAVGFNATLNETANALIVTTTSALSSGEAYKVTLDRESFKDLGGNIVDGQGLAYVSLSDNQAKVIVSFQAFDSTATTPNPNTVALTQTLEQSAGQSDYPLTYQINKVIKDVSSLGGVQQLNSTADDDKFNGNDTAERLLNLAKAFVESATDDDNLRQALIPEAFAVDHARVEFNYVKGTDLPRYAVAVNNDQGLPENVKITAADLPEGVTVQNNESLQAELVVADSFNGQIHLTLSGVSTGYQVVITPMNVSGDLLIGKQGQLLLQDLIPATTVVQRSYGQGLKSTKYVSSQLGAGGELVDATSAIGPYLNITPWLLAQTQAGGMQVTNAETVWQNLTAGIERDPATGKAVVDVTFPDASGYIGYDIPAVTNWLANLGPRNMAVAFSENISLTGTPALSNISTALSGWGAYNNIYQTVLGNVVNEDLVTMQVANVFTFANDDHNGVIDFASVVSDSQGNVSTADENPKVIIRDLMPPMALSAELIANDVARCNGSVYCMVINFNEPVTLQADDQFTLFSSMKSGAIQSETLTFADKNASNNSATSQLIIDLTRYQEANDGLLSIDDYRLNFKELFDRGETYDADGFSQNPTTMLSFSDVRDIHGVSWNNWYEGDASPMKKPAVAMTRTAVPKFAVALDPTNSSINASNVITLVYHATHAFHLESIGTDFDAAAAFEIERASPLSPAITILPISRAKLTDKGRTVTITIETDEPFAAGDVIKGTTFESAWNSSIALTMGDITVP